MITIEDVDKRWNALEKYKETAEQSEFTSLMAIDMRVVPLYNDLKDDFNEHHAELFCRFFDTIVKPQFNLQW